jgi:hypothetical protein
MTTFIFRTASGGEFQKPAEKSYPDAATALESVAEAIESASKWVQVHGRYGNALILSNSIVAVEVIGEYCKAETKDAIDRGTLQLAL